MFDRLQRSLTKTGLMAATLAVALSGCSTMNSLNPFAGNDDAAPQPAPQQQAPTSIQSAPQQSTAPAYGGPVVERVSEPVPLASDAPDEYVVQVGDTLWDIAAAFLDDPWFWPEIWYVNPDIVNPHLIYPGDVLGLVTIDGQQRVTPVRASTYRLSPQARVTPLTQAVTSIPYNAVSAFLSSGTVLEKNEADRLPYLLEVRGDHLVAASGNEVYIRGAGAVSPGSRYSVVHVGEPLVDPDNNRVVGYQGIYVGAGTLRRGGDPATVRLTDAKQEAVRGDRFVPEAVDIPLNFYPSPPSNAIDGRIIHVVGGVTQIGQYQVVVINRGSNDGLATGHVLSVFQAGQTVRDRIGGGKVKLPDEQAGTVMVFKVYDEIGYGLVMEATQSIHINDAVRNPI